MKYFYYKILDVNNEWMCFRDSTSKKKSEYFNTRDKQWYPILYETPAQLERRHYRGFTRITKEDFDSYVMLLELNK